MKQGLCLLVGLLAFACTVEDPVDLESEERDAAVDPEMSVQGESLTFGEGYRGYLVRPRLENRLPGVVMIHEWWGLNDNIREMAESLAARNFVVLAVDLFDGKVATTPEQAREYSSEARQNLGQAIEKMKSAVSFLRQSDFVKEDAVASMGWCFGGGMSMQLALNETLAATVIYYGALESDPEKLSRIQWPILGVFADEDTVVPIDSVRAFENAVNQLGIQNEIYVYEGVGHAFANPSNPGHDSEKAQDAWTKTVAFLDRTLK